MCEISNNLENDINIHGVFGIRNIRLIFIINHGVLQH